MARILHVLDILDDDDQREQGRRPRIVRERVDPLELYDDVDLVKRFRFRRRDIEFILHEIEGELQHRSERNSALPPSLQLLLALRFFASGSFQNVVGDSIHVSAPTVCRAVRKVAVALSNRLHQYVYLSQDNQYLQETKEMFADIAGFPNVIACVDGTQIPIQAPSEAENEYVNRKGQHSLNIQVMCDAKMKFVNTVIRWPGSTHDARILTTSNIFREFENGQHNGLVLGDSAYPLKPWLMTPFIAVGNDAETRYNVSHSSTRSLVERSIGRLKRRFACLRYLRMYPPRACAVIACCIVLHNIAIERGVPMPEDNEEPPDEQQADIAGGDHQDQNIPGRARRAQIAQQLFE